MTRLSPLSNKAQFMKPSYYNSIVTIGDRTLLFNALSLDFIVIPNEIKSDFLEFLNKPNCNWGDLEIMKAQLIEKQFIIPNSVNEYNIIQKQISEGKTKPHYTIMLLPTYSCNLSCWYCVQKHNKDIMSEQLISSIKRHIIHYLQTNDIKSFEIHWFGGEPMLCFESHIIELSRFAIEVCDHLGIKFFNNITTNGSLMDIHQIMLMKELRFMQFQITIDGSRDTHNLTRNHKGEPTFDLIINQIKNILEIIPEAQVYLRYNFTTENFSEIDELIQQLNIVFNKHIRGQIKVSPVKVWQEKRTNLPNDCFEQIYTKFKAAGYDLADADMCHDFTKCIADMKHSCVVFPNGHVDKCNNIAPQEARYRLSDNGDIKLRDSDTAESSLDEIPESCMICRSYPACLGPCWKFKNYAVKTNGYVKCMDSMANIGIKERIRNFCILKLIESKYEII